MKVHFLSFIFSAGFALIVSSCAPHSGFETLELPQEHADLQDLHGKPSQTEEPDGIPDFQDMTDPDPSTWPEPAKSHNSDWGQWLVTNAKWVIDNESKKIGPVCNYFIQRVLYLRGFGTNAWVATEFDKYVLQNFSSFQKASFVFDPNGRDKARLKKYLLSRPEHSGVILQWKRKKGHGHIAILERVQNNFVIYHASLNKFSPKAQTATVDLLLHKPSRNNTYILNVYSDLKKEAD